MLKKIFIICIIFSSFGSFGQLIKGTILDENKNPLPAANIYLDGTSLATMSDASGFFQLDLSQKINTQLVVSFIGYETVYLSDYYEKAELVIELKPSVKSLKEVVVTKPLYTRKQMLKLFREQFLGITKAGRKAMIVNEEDLELEYDIEKKALIANSEKPLLIKNPVLGYEVTYEISAFRVGFNRLSISSTDVKQVLFAGASRFKEIDFSEKTKAERLKTYNGSVLHFFRSMVQDKLSENNFKILKNKKLTTVRNEFTVNYNEGIQEVAVNKNDYLFVNGKQLKFLSDFRILYQDKLDSSVTFFTKNFTVDEFGIHSNVGDILFSGDMSVKRIGDILPLNYGLDQ